MNRRLSTAAATAALAALPLLAACGDATSTQPAPSGTAPATQAAPSASTEPAATPTTPAPSASPTSPTSSSSFDKAKESRAAAIASEKFAGAVFSLGYPDASTDTYFRRMRPLTTDRAYVEVKEGAEKSDFAKLGKQLVAQRARSSSGVEGAVTVVKVDAGSAETSFKLLVKFQQRDGGGWKTTRTPPAEPEKLELVKQDGRWLVDHLPQG